MDAGLTGRVVLITGAGGGAGPTFVRAFAAEGAAVAAHYRGDPARAEAAAAEIRSAGGRALAVQADLTSTEQVVEMVRRIDHELGPVAVLVNATSLYREDALVDIDDDTWTSVHDAMLGAAFRVSRAVAPGMAAVGFGRIVNIASRSGLVGAASLAHYASAKAGIVGLTRALAKELGPSGVLVNAVAPTVIVTDRGEGGRSVSEEDEARLTRSVPLRRYATADDVARVLVWLGSGYKSYLTGEVLTLSGGARS